MLHQTTVRAVWRFKLDAVTRFWPLASVLFVFLAVPFVDAATITLSADRSGHSDVTNELRRAVTAAGAGGTLSIPAGTYKVSASQKSACGNTAVYLPELFTVRPQGAVIFVNAAGRSEGGGFVFGSSRNHVHITNGVNETAGIQWGHDPRNPDGSGSGTFESDGLGAFCEAAHTNPNHLATDVVVTGWYAHDLYQSNGHGLLVTGIVDGLVTEHNWFFNIVHNGGQNVTFEQIYTPPNCVGSGECNWDGVAMAFLGGIANAKIERNIIDWTGNDGIYAFWNDAVSNRWYHVCNNIWIIGNMFNRVQRISLEMQAVSSGCEGGCRTYSPGSNFYVQSNWDRTHWFPTTNSWGFSINNNFKNYGFLNNTMSYGTRSDNSNRVMYFAYPGWESAMEGGLAQGNVWSVDRQTFPHYTDRSTNGRSGAAVQKISNWESMSAAGAEYSVANNNNVLCGGGDDKGLNGQFLDDFAHNRPTSRQQTHWVGSDGDQKNKENDFSASYPRMTFTGNFKSASCPYAGRVDQPDLKLAFSSADNQTFASGKEANGTWRGWVTSALSVDRVSFYIDDAKTPVVSQDIQDVSQTFDRDRKWLYHATFDVAKFSAGTHKVKMMATDVSGNSQSVTQTFLVKGGA